MINLSTIQLNDFKYLKSALSVKNIMVFILEKMKEEKGSMKYKKIILIIIFASSQLSFAATIQALEISKNITEIPNHGIKFRNFESAQILTQKPQNLLTYRPYSSRKSTPARKIEVYDLNQLWLSDQIIARYQNDLVNVEIFKVHSLIPIDQAYKIRDKFYIKKSDYKRKKTSLNNDKYTIRKWFYQLEKRGLTLFKKFGNNYLPKEFQYILNDKNPGTYGFLISTSDKRSFYLKIKSNTKNKQELENSIMTLIRYFQISQEKEQKSSFFSIKARATTSKSAEYRETVDRVKKELSGMTDWWFVETENYIIKTNLTTRNRIFIRRIQAQVEQMRKLYEIFLPANKPFQEVSVITIPATREEYQNYVSNDVRWSGGLWDPSRRELILSTVNKDADQPVNRDRVIEVLNHEAFHQYLFYALDKIRSPMWFNEGHAELFEHSKFSPGRVVLEENLYSLRNLELLIKTNTIDIKSHIYANRKTFYSNRNLNYSLAWAICYFLRMAAPLYESSDYNEIMPKIINALRQGKSPDEATSEGFDKINLEKFKEDFCSFWQNESLRSKAKRTKINSLKRI